MSRKLEFIMDVKEVRRLNLEYLIAAVGSIKALADAVYTDPNYISQIKNGNSGKKMGDKFARKLESAFSKPIGWMDKLQVSKDDSIGQLNDEGLLSLAVKNVINQLIAAGIYEPKKSIDSEAVTSLIVTEYKSLISDKDATRTGVGDNHQAL
ncbi:hypothetical protein ALT761_01975 [Alteromonas sp. 76-1]|jgi:hypothetical protein|uniref:hypothetical protein n=1 Tax=Alteromonas sp. 76-1 TaxID=2358187 RepID=UPI000FD16616|nr:hypothetical protein [Alteromonas sp. 76-1]VEL96976.1 hypothetical protein ALT761_01975 [Alteromonas sp. 76-1]